jgi:hypothetical protein
MDTEGGRRKDKPNNIVLFDLINYPMICLRYALYYYTVSISDHTASSDWAMGNNEFGKIWKAAEATSVTSESWVWLEEHR